MKKFMIMSFVVLVSLVTTLPLMASETAGKAMIPDGTNITVGFKWDHCQQVYHYINSNYTYCYLETNKIWVYTNDDMAENMLIACAESNHWCGFNFTTTGGSWNYVKLWKL